MKQIRQLRQMAVLLVVLITGSRVQTLCAQQLSTPAESHMQRLYKHAYNECKRPSGLILADSLLHLAHRYGDKKYEVRALEVKFLHEYYQPNNLDRLNVATKALVDCTERYGMWDNYYRCLGNKVSYLVREQRYLEAFIYLKEQQEKAEKIHSHLGVQWCYRMTGVLQQYRGQLSQAIGFYEQAIDYSKQHLPEHPLNKEYLSISDCYRMMGNYKKMLEAAQWSATYATDRVNHYDATLYQCYAYYMMGDKPKFREMYDSLATYESGFNSLRDVVSMAVSACKLMDEGKDSLAVKAIRQVGKQSTIESYLLSAVYFEQKGDPVRAIEYMRHVIRHHYAFNKFLLDKDIQAVNVIFRDQNIEREQQRLLNENAQIAVANTALSLRNSSLELSRSREAALLAEAAERQNTLSASHQQLVVRQLRDSLTTEQLIRETQEHKMHRQRLTLIGIWGFALIVLAGGLIHSLHRRRALRRLIGANRQLGTTIHQLNEAKVNAVASEKAKTHFIQNMSHEIRTPLNAIVGFTQVLSDMGDEMEKEERKGIIKIITENSMLLTTLVSDILDLTSLESGHFVLNNEKVTVNKTCRHTIDTVAHRKADDVTLHFKSEVDDSYAVFTDDNRVRQVLINMLTNAEKNTEHGTITLIVTLSERPGMLTFVVEDTGIGVPEDKQKAIFQRFQKLDSFKQGTGLGLDICRTIATKLNGEIDIDPSYTGGARFWFAIPVSQ